MGLALGLFAIFGIIRYRTNSIPTKEMTYLFVIIGISVINALSGEKVSYAELIFANMAIVATMWILELILMLRQENCLKIIYEKIENIQLNRKDELMKDLQDRTGIKVKRIKIDEINFLRNEVKIRIYHDVNGHNSEIIQNGSKI